MTTINQLADEFGFDNAHGLRVWADDLLSTYASDGDALGDEDERVLREAYAHDRSLNG